jgi:hypothetical protein
VIPEIIIAAAETAVAVEGGVSMFGNGKKDGQAAAPPAAPTVVVNGLSKQDFLIGICILALALLAMGVIIHHGLTA